MVWLCNCEFLATFRVQPCSAGCTQGYSLREAKNEKKGILSVELDNGLPLVEARTRNTSLAVTLAWAPYRHFSNPSVKLPEDSSHTSTLHIKVFATSLRY